MTKQEAIQAMKEGHKVTHQYFTPDEWMASTGDGYLYHFEDGVAITHFTFWKYRNEDGWEDGYSIFQPKTKLI